MSRAVVTIACGSFYERLAAITHPTIQAYADRIGADFIVWREFGSHVMPHYQKLELAKVLDQYDRVLYIDTDVLVRGDTPDLFEIVPEDELGAFDETPYINRNIDMIQFMTAVGCDPWSWDGKYYNTGVMVLSKCHQHLFYQPERELNAVMEQSYLNLVFSRTKTKMYPLPHRFNRMAFMDWFSGENRCDCYLLHYAGLLAYISENEYLSRVIDDRTSWELNGPHYRYPKHLALVIEGGVADQVAAEPAVRFAREVLHKDDRLVIVSQYPQLFGHLLLPVYAALDQVADRNHCAPRYNRPPSAKPPSPVLDAHHVHPVDFASLNLLGRELPLASRQPRISVDPAARDSALRKVGQTDLARAVLLHASSQCECPAATAAAWRQYAATLSENGFAVTWIGNLDQGEFASLPIDAPRSVDLTGALTLDELVALVSETPLLVTNSPQMVQVAGAFDRWIGFECDGAAAEFALPWRHGSQCFRAQQLDVAASAAAILHLARESQQNLAVS
jgi:hypothetical protein